MAIALVQRAGASAASGTVQVVLNSVVAGNAIILLGYSFNTTGWSFTDDNGTPVQDIAMYNPAVYAYSIWSVLNCNAGTHTLDLVSGTVNSTIHAWEISGLATSNAFDVTMPGGGASAISISTLTIGPTDTTTQADELVIAFATNNSAGTMSSSDGSNILAITDVTFGKNSGSAIKIVSSTGTQSIDFTSSVSNTRIDGVIATYKGAASGGGRIFKLAGEGGGLAGPSRGLVAKSHLANWARSKSGIYVPSNYIR